MQIKKVFNNNVAIVLDSGVEKIIIGKGIGFKKYPGDPVKEELIEKEFIPKQGDRVETLATFFNEVPIEIIQLTMLIIDKARRHLGEHITDSFLIPLADHIDFALTRSKEGIEVEYPLNWEMKHLYPEEIAFAKECLTLVYEQTGITLPKTEVVPIAMHFVNAKHNTDNVSSPYEMTALVKKIIDTIQYHFFIELDEESLYYARFITHLRYFILRHMEGQPHQSEDDILYEVVKKKYEEAFECALKIKRLLGGTMGWNISSDEVLYLALHIQRISSKEKTL